MSDKKFASVSALPSNPKWNEYIHRETELYTRKNDIRSEFNRDYNRILHCNAYRRLKHKTQVFFATSNDHICTRLEHVNHVSSVSYTIADYLGLNTELTAAISIGHDLGHAPFGHVGERILEKILQDVIGDTFWHEGNSLRFADYYETLSDPEGYEQNLCLTYAVRDGIVCHCGEVDENALRPRDQIIDLYEIKKAGEYPPFSWEGCVVKIADKISYLGRDIEDAYTLGILTEAQKNELSKIIKSTLHSDLNYVLNNTVVMHEFIMDICKESSPDKGISLSKRYFEFMNALKMFNYANIYGHERLQIYSKYAELIIRSIFNILLTLYNPDDVLRPLEDYRKIYPTLMSYFIDWIIKYSDLRICRDLPQIHRKKTEKFKNKVVYSIGSKDDYIRAVADYISGMTDSFAIKVFQELTGF
ncbi:MAG: deoxyguanosinetriphosphate triphosphohydrolase family protein [Clostridia bacterium]|jgi:dGTPase|nr:HD domain-containing protein [Clostridiaceae bacterium]